MSEFGVWAMIAFWASAIGGIALAISWANARNKNPVSKELLKKSLRQRLEKGEIDQAEYDKRLHQLEQEERSSSAKD